MTSRCLLKFTCVVVLGLGIGTSGSAEPLDIEPGQDPGGIAVAMIAEPFHIGQVDISEKLARDGEGVAIGWNFSNRPNSSDVDVTEKSLPATSALATTLATRSGLRFVPVFVDPLRPTTWAQAVAFVAQTPARIVVVPFATDMETDWVAFRAAAEHFPQLLFIVPAQSMDREATDQSTPKNELSYPAALQLANVLSVSAPGIVGGDIAINVGSETATPDMVLALTVKALLFCPSSNDNTEPEWSKVEALTKLSTLTTAQPTPLPPSATPVITPCGEALN